MIDTPRTRRATGGKHRRQPSWASWPGRTRAAGRLLFPGVVAICLSIPCLLPGALAFDLKGDFTFGAAEVGAVVAAFYLLSTVATQLSTRLLTRFTPLTMTRLGLLLGVCALLGAAVLGNKPGVWWMCLVGGLANGLATPSANLLIALTIPAGRRGLAFGLRVSAVPAAAAITAAGAYVVAHTDHSWRSFAVAAGVLLVNVLLASFAGSAARLPLLQSRSAAEDRGEGTASLNLIALGGLLAATACSTLSPFLVEGLIDGGVEPGTAALMLGVSAWIGVAARITAGLLADRFPRPHHHLSSASAMLAIAAVGMLGLGFGTGTSALAGATLLTFGIGWAWPGLLHHATIALHPGHMAKATSLMQVGTYVGALLGPLAFGLLADLGSFRLAWSATAAMAALACVTILIGRRQSLPARPAT